MRSLHQWFLDGTEEEDQAHASRRAFLAGSLKLAGGSALALALTGAPGVRQFVAADSHEGQATDGQATGGAQDGGQATGGGQDGGRAGGQAGGQAGGRAPRVGIGTTAGSDGRNIAGLIGVAAAAAAGAAALTYRRSRVEQEADA